MSGGSWSADQIFGRPTAVAAPIAPLMRRRPEGLPRPATTLGLHVLIFGPRPADQLALELEGGERNSRRGRRLATAIGEVHIVAGGEALLRIEELDPSSRVSERRFVLNLRLDELGPCLAATVLR